MAIKVHFLVHICTVTRPILSLDNSHNKTSVIVYSVVKCGSEWWDDRNSALYVELPAGGQDVQGHTGVHLIICKIKTETCTSHDIPMARVTSRVAMKIFEGFLGALFKEFVMGWEPVYQSSTTLGLDPVSIVHYTRPGSCIKQPT